MTTEVLFLMTLFGVVAAVSYGLCRMFVRPGDRVTDRLRPHTPAKTPLRPAPVKPTKTLMQRIGETAAKPLMPKTQQGESAMRRRLAQAGISARGAVSAMIGLKVLSLIGGMVIGYLIGLWLEYDLLGLIGGALVGYKLPDLLLSMRIRANHRALSRALPDALDLMVVCVEAGLTMESSMQRVGQELTRAHPELARELSVSHLETQMGVPRSEALRNLAVRTGSPELKGLVAMLVQAERLGTSIGKALRVQAESLRSKRHYAAQELAAKASVKLIFPVAMLIFPAVLVVLVGPAIIQMLESGFLIN